MSHLKRFEPGSKSGTDDEDSWDEFDPMAHDFKTSMVLTKEDTPEKKDVPCRFHDGFSGRCWKGDRCPYGHKLYTGGLFAKENPVWSAAANSIRMVNSLFDLNPDTVLKKGESFKARITSVKDPTDFFVRRTLEPSQGLSSDVNLQRQTPQTSSSRSASETLNSFLRMGERYRAYREDEYFPMTELVAVRVKSHWKRAVLRQCFGNENGMLRALLLDTGEDCLVEKNDVCRLPDQFCKSPPEALKCSLYGISPVVGHWCSQAVKVFKDFVMDKEIMTIIECGNSEHDNFSIFERYPLFVKIEVDSDDGSKIDVAKVLAKRGLGLVWKNA